MRDIKYRMWNKKEKKMYEVGQINFDGKRVFMKNYNMYICSSYSFEDIELMQFTGLHDKNGKEIYEGDIVQEVFWDKWEEKERRYKKYVVKYDKDRAGYIPFACGDGCGCCESEVISVENAEVIGNTYDNSELLKGADNIE